MNNAATTYDGNNEMTIELHCIQNCHFSRAVLI